MIHEAFDLLRERILDLADDENEIIETPRKLYISYPHGKNFAEVVVQAKALRVFLDIALDDLDDPARIARDVSNVGHWGTGNVEVRVTDPQDVDSVFSLIEQAYRLTL